MSKPTIAAGYRLVPDESIGDKYQFWGQCKEWRCVASDNTPARAICLAIVEAAK
jgi:hypothetical protein